MVSIWFFYELRWSMENNCRTVGIRTHSPSPSWIWYRHCIVHIPIHVSWLHLNYLLFSPRTQCLDQAYSSCCINVVEWPKLWCGYGNSHLPRLREDNKNLEGKTIFVFLLPVSCVWNLFHVTKVATQSPSVYCHWSADNFQSMPR